MYQTIFKCVTSKKGLNRFFECGGEGLVPHLASLAHPDIGFITVFCFIFNQAVRGRKITLMEASGSGCPWTPQKNDIPKKQPDNQ